MVFTVLSRALLLVSLLPLCTQSVDDELVDIGSLGKITEFFRNNYEMGQYAVAINVPKVQCFTFDESTFLKGENNVRQDLQKFIPIYSGTELIAAGVFLGKHSEDLLMNPPNESYLKKLLAKKGSDGCVVFYTLNSPCIDKCLSDNDDSILKGLNELNAHTGIKAFAFKHIYEFDQTQNKSILRAELGKVAELVPLYRCFYECILCGIPGASTPIAEECTLTTEEFRNYINKINSYSPSKASG
ncbi:uncharacterized protein LOC127976961 [Carassius gibelio]|uniref:uncharacterized protein LOC127976961 n=1 Tax=Carassius gibelio TaxID=101364 RepID=UPI002277481E|nr:uncharacterized protein LOC127976961 [Carassius gibelio]